jgi:hypothetical protein
MFLFRRKRNDKKDEGEMQVGSPGVAPAATTGLSYSRSDGDDADNNKAYGKFGLSPPKSTRSVPCVEAGNRIQRDGFGNYLEEPAGKTSDVEKAKEKAKMLVFLYGRGFMSDEHEACRKNNVEKMIFGSKDASVRLLRVIDALGDKDLTITADRDDCDFYRRYGVTLQRYFQQEGAFGFLPDMTEAKYFYRFQKCGNCYLQGPCVMVAYLAEKYGIADPCPVDVSKLVRHSFTDDKLYSYVVEDAGGSSIGILKQLLRTILDESNPPVDSYSAGTVRESTFPLEGLVAKYGPALVSTFVVHNRFGNYSLTKTGNERKKGYVQFDGATRTQGKFVELTAPEGVAPKEEEEAVELILKEYVEGYHGSIKKNLHDKHFANHEKIDLGNNHARDRNRDKLANEGDNTGRHATVFIGGFPDKKDKKAELGNNHDETHETNLWDHDKAGNEGKSIGSHAMVLIGGRRDPKVQGKKWLLLQNWWENMPLVEVSDEYFKNVEGQLTFFAGWEVMDQKKENISLESCYSMNQSLVAESCIDDKPGTAF